MPEPPLVDQEDLVNYDGTPWLTALANFCAAVGVFVGAYAVIFLLGALHRGFGAYWGLLLILALDLAVNVVVQAARWRRRRALGLSRRRRRYRMGLDDRRR